MKSCLNLLDANHCRPTPSLQKNDHLDIKSAGIRTSNLQVVRLVRIIKYNTAQNCRYAFGFGSPSSWVAVLQTMFLETFPAKDFDRD
jgi:hypothetical protein